MQVFTVKPPQREPEHATADQHLKIRVPVHGRAARARRRVPEEAVDCCIETARQPYQAHFNYYRHPRVQPAIYSISIVGPYGAQSPGDTPEPAPDLRLASGRRRSRKTRAASQILSALMKRAYRRPVTAADLRGPLALFEKGRAEAASTPASRWRWRACW